MREKLSEKIRREFWDFLRSQGFLGGVDAEAIMREASRIEVQAEFKRFRLRIWDYGAGGEHGDDVALVKLLADCLGFEQGRDWDREYKPDNYHFSIVYSRSSRVDELHRLLDLYHDADLVRLQVYTRQGENLSSGELQQLFREEWNKVRDEKLRMRQESLKALEAFRRMPEA